MSFENNPNSVDKRFEAWFRKYYLNLILGFLLIFSIIPVFAPVLMKFGLTFPAKIIYWVYSFFCHQFPFRSWFLFGAQPFYPLALTGISQVNSFESTFQITTLNLNSVRSIIGNPYAGYKIAICQRDTAMYLSLFAFGLFFMIRNKRIKRISFGIWLLAGVLPLGLDGLTQYLGNYPLPFFGYLIRESTPLLRTITGSLFGLLTGWYIFPTLETIVNKK
jgi:uncharacterized membrane protein